MEQRYRDEREEDVVSTPRRSVPPSPRHDGVEHTWRRSSSIFSALRTQRAHHVMPSNYYYYYYVYIIACTNACIILSRIDVYTYFMHRIHCTTRRIAYTLTKNTSHVIIYYVYIYICINIICIIVRYTHCLRPLATELRGSTAATTLSPRRHFQFLHPVHRAAAVRFAG